MAWSWSYSDEGLSAIMAGIENLPLDDLITCYAEFEAYRLRNRSNVKFDFNRTAYRRGLHQARLIADTGEDILVSAIQSRAEELATSDNGGWNAYVCPYGCHTVNLKECMKLLEQPEEKD